MTNNPISTDIKNKNTQIIEKNRNKMEIKLNEKKTFTVFNAKSPLNKVLRTISKKTSDIDTNEQKNNEKLKKYLVNFETNINNPNSARINYK